MTTTECIALVHQHRAFPAPDDEEVRAALAAEGLEPVQILRCVVGSHGADGTAENWPELHRQQSAWFADHMSALPTRRIAYFGCTYIPLALGLGRLTTSWRECLVFQHNHLTKRWTLASARKGGVNRRVETDELRASRQDVPIGVVVAASYRVADEDVRLTKGCKNIAYAEVRVEPPDPDALETDGLLEDVVAACIACLNAAILQRPEARARHLFLSVPVGAAFRIGQELNPTIHRPLYGWKFVNTQEPNLPRYHHAWSLGEEGNVRILFLAAEPKGSTPKDKPRLRLDQEARTVARELRMATYRDWYQPHFEQAVRQEDLMGHLVEHEPRVLHFAGHSTADGCILLEDAAGHQRQVTPQGFAKAIALSNKEDPKISCVVLNACYSDELARVLVAEGDVDVVLGWAIAANDGAAIQFAKEFYGTLAAGKSVGRAFDIATAQVASFSLGQSDGLRMRSRDGLNPYDLYLSDIARED